MARGKKADLSLSINAIVILILAITMLGLGLTFLRGTFTKTTAEFASVSESVKTQIIDEIKSSNEKLIFNKLEVSIHRGESVDLFYGIKNVLDGKKTFTIIHTCDKALANSGLTQADIEKVITLNTFDTWDVAQGEIEVLKLTVSATSEAKSDTYSCSLTVKDGATEYASKKFFVVVG